jgi:hypothetical protein
MPPRTPATRTRLEAVFDEAKGVPRWPLIIGIVLILVGIIYSMHGIGLPGLLDVKSISSFIKEVGFAFMIAFVLSIAIESKARREHNALVQTHLHALNRNVFQALYGIRTPQGLFEQVEDTIIKQKFFRRNVHMVYQFMPASTSKVFVMDVDLNYHVENISRDQDSFRIPVTLEKPFLKDVSDKVKLRAIVIDGKHLSDQELQEARDAAPDCEKFIRFSHNVDVDGESTRRIEIKYTMVKLHQDYEVWRSVFPCDGLRLTVTVPQGVEILAHQIHPTPLRESVGKHGDTLREWVLERPVLPYQGVLIWWRSEQVSQAEEDRPKAPGADVKERRA